MKKNDRIAYILKKAYAGKDSGGIDLLSQIPADHPHRYRAVNALCGFFPDSYIQRHVTTSAYDIHLTNILRHLLRERNLEELRGTYNVPMARCFFSKSILMADDAKSWDEVGEAAAVLAMPPAVISAFMRDLREDVRETSAFLLSSILNGSCSFEAIRPSMQAEFSAWIQEIYWTWSDGGFRVWEGEGTDDVKALLTHIGIAEGV